MDIDAHKLEKGLKADSERTLAFLGSLEVWAVGNVCQRCLLMFGFMLGSKRMA
jgi:hypothetical protein